jgi:uncharacterized membrane protein YkoI
MKKFLACCAVFAFCALSSCSSKKVSATDVPAAALAAFNAKYPGATNTEWITEKKNDKTIYEAQFKLNDKNVEAEFEADGTFIQED